ncbi:MAG: hypothetical protein AAF517_05560, partial [Planctomycetota bacterium]
PKSVSGARVAVLYFENEGQRLRTRSYSGFAQALAESNIPYDVLVDGDGGFVSAELDSFDLQRYEVVVVPQALHLAPSQRDALHAYVTKGGRALVADADGLDIPKRQFEVVRGEGKFILMPRVELPGFGKVDLGEAYSREYDEAYRRRIESLVVANSSEVLEVKGVDRTVTATVQLQEDEGRIIVHLVNADYDPESDRMRSKRDVILRVRRPDFYRFPREAHVYSPDLPEGADDKPLALPPTVRGGFIEVIVPELEVYSVVVL